MDKRDGEEQERDLYEKKSRYRDKSKISHEREIKRIRMTKRTHEVEGGEAVSLRW